MVVEKEKERRVGKREGDVRKRIRKKGKGRQEEWGENLNVRVLTTHFIFIKKTKCI